MHMYNETVKLITVLNTSEDENGYTVEGDTREVTVYAYVKSVKYTEYYAALAANMHVQNIFVMDPHDYEMSYIETHGTTGRNRTLKASKLEYDGRLYRIVRTYKTQDNTIELTCAEVE